MTSKLAIYHSNSIIFFCSFIMHFARISKLYNDLTKVITD